jgi:hypothetical protein
MEIELNRVMDNFHGRMEYIIKLLDKNSRENPISVVDAKFIDDTRSIWLDLAPLYPFIKLQDEKMFFAINQFFFAEQPPV